MLFVVLNLTVICLIPLSSPFNRELSTEKWTMNLTRTHGETAWASATEVLKVTPGHTGGRGGALITIYMNIKSIENRTIWNLIVCDSLNLKKNDVFVGWCFDCYITLAGAASSALHKRLPHISLERTQNT